MKTELLQDLVSDVMNEVQKLSDQKGVEYSSSKDRLLNFRRGVNSIMQNERQVCMAYATKHWTSLELDATDETPLSLDQHWEKTCDVILYAILCHGLKIENTP